jgi:DnaJ domain
MRPPPEDLDFYSVLGVAPDASPLEIKRAYHALCMRHHPDRQGLNPKLIWRAEVLMRQINRAYAVLSNSQKRQYYDEYLRQLRAAKAASARPAVEEDPAPDADYGNPLVSKLPSQHWLTELLQWISAQRANKQTMGTFNKMLLAPVPFCITIIVSSLFWQLRTLPDATVPFVLSAVLAYPLILVPLLVRLWFPIRYRPWLDLPEKLVGIPAILIAATLLGALWFAVIDHNGTVPNPLDLYWWCGLITITCVSLACL